MQLGSLRPLIAYNGWMQKDVTHGALLGGKMVDALKAVRELQLDYYSEINSAVKLGHTQVLVMEQFRILKQLLVGHANPRKMKFTTYSFTKPSRVS